MGISAHAIPKTTIGKSRFREKISRKPPAGPYLATARDMRDLGLAMPTRDSACKDPPFRARDAPSNKVRGTPRLNHEHAFLRLSRAVGVLQPELAPRCVFPDIRIDREELPRVRSRHLSRRDGLSVP